MIRLFFSMNDPSTFMFMGASEIRSKVSFSCNRILSRSNDRTCQMEANHRIVNCPIAKRFPYYFLS